MRRITCSTCGGVTAASRGPTKCSAQLAAAVAVAVRTAMTLGGAVKRGGTAASNNGSSSRHQQSHASNLPRPRPSRISAAVPPSTHHQRQEGRRTTESPIISTVEDAPPSSSSSSSWPYTSALKEQQHQPKVDRRGEPNAQPRPPQRRRTLREAASNSGSKSGAHTGRGGQNGVSSPSSRGFSPLAKTNKTGWELAEVDEEGFTELDHRYSKSHGRVLEVLREADSVINGMTASDSSSGVAPTTRAVTQCHEKPTVMIGFGQYVFKLRDQYRHALLQAVQHLWPEVVALANTGPTTTTFSPSSGEQKREMSGASASGTNDRGGKGGNISLDCPITSVSQLYLSSAWASRADVDRMPNATGIHKVLGLTFLPPPPLGEDCATEDSCSDGDAIAEASASALDAFLNPAEDGEGDHTSSSANDEASTSASTTPQADHATAGFDEHLRPHLSRLAVSIVELINSRRFEPMLSVNMQAATQPSLPQPKKLQDAALRDCILKLRRLVSSHTVAIFYRDPAAVAKEEALRNSVAFNPEQDDTASHPKEADLLEKYTNDFHLKRQKWRKFYHSQRIIPLEVDLDRVVVDSIKASRLVGRPSASALIATIGTSPAPAPATSSRSEVSVLSRFATNGENNEERIAAAVATVNSSEKKLWFQALAAICSNPGSLDPEFPAFFIRGVYSGTDRQFKYMAHRPELFKSLASGQGHHVKLKERKVDMMSKRQKHGLDRESQIST